MTKRIQTPALTAYFIAVLAALPLLFPNPSCAQEEVASSLRRYKKVRPAPATMRIMRLRRAACNLWFHPPPASAAASLTVRQQPRCGSGHACDSHQGIKFYKVLRCEYCHAEQAKDMHTVRANLTCRQCHGGEPIASIEHTYSSMNPIRRHSYVSCAKCHEGASASYATYVVHQPGPGSLTAKREFPALYYTYWFMLALLVGTLAFFLPHTFLVGFRELFTRLKTRKIEAHRNSEHQPEEEHPS